MNAWIGSSLLPVTKHFSFCWKPSLALYYLPRGSSRQAFDLTLNGLHIITSNTRHQASRVGPSHNLTRTSDETCPESQIGSRVGPSHNLTRTSDETCPESLILSTFYSSLSTEDMMPLGSCKNRRFGGIYRQHASTSILLLLVTANVPSSSILVTLMLEKICSSQTSVITGATGRTIPEDGILHSHHRVNLKSYIALTGWTL
jgi:hypothetical protein